MANSTYRRFGRWALHTHKVRQGPPWSGAGLVRLTDGNQVRGISAGIGRVAFALYRLTPAQYASDLAIGA